MNKNNKYNIRLVGKKKKIVDIGAMLSVLACMTLIADDSFYNTLFVPALLKYAKILWSF